MKRKITKIITLAAAFLMVLTMTACADGAVRAAPDVEAVSQNTALEDPSPKEETLPKTRSAGQIYLYGEEHAQETIMEKEADLWYEYYHSEGLRHLFIEWPYYHRRIFESMDEIGT